MKRETFLDKEVGYTYTTEEITITSDDVNIISSFLGEGETIFHDDEFARSLNFNFKGKIIPAAFLIMMFTKLDILTGYTFDAVMVGMNDIRVLSPTYVGDRLWLEGELINKRITSKGHVLAIYRWTLKNQDGQSVITGINNELFSNKLLF